MLTREQLRETANAINDARRERAKNELPSICRKINEKIESAAGKGLYHAEIELKSVASKEVYENTFKLLCEWLVKEYQHLNAVTGLSLSNIPELRVNW